MKENKTNIKIIISIILLITLFFITIWFIIEIYHEKKITGNKVANFYNIEETATSKNTKQQINNKEKQDQTNETKQEIKENTTENSNITPSVIENYNGYTVTAKLDIPDISLETYVLKNYSEQALNISVTKFWGADANEVGNFCIAGHNFQNKMMFHNLKKLKIGDMLYITDNKNGKIAYKIYDIYTVFPKDVSCLSQQTNGKKEVTLITCTNDSVKRIIVKAKQ